MSKYEVEWADGVKTRLDILSQSLTYGNLLAGIPTLRSNELFHLSPLLTSEDKDKWLLLWAPQNKVASWPETFMGSPTAALPAVKCLATFRSLFPARDKTMEASCVNVAWFQEEWALPLIPEVLEKIRALNWCDVAIDYEL